MKLYSLTLRGYRRFEGSWINLEGRVVAIVGPNEAGKSSILAALTALNSDEPIGIGALTRGATVPADADVITARFRLSAEERLMAPSPLKDSEAIWLLVAKKASGARTFRLDPAPTRDNEHRQRAASWATKVLTRSWLQKAEAPADDTTEEPPPTLEDQITIIANDLQSNAATLSDDVKQRVESGIGALRDLAALSTTSKTSRREIERLVTALEDDLAVETLPHPTALTNTLRSHVPEFLDFDDQNRSLRSEYDLANQEHVDSPALVNLAAVADLSLPAMQDAIAANDTGRIRSLLEAAQDRLDQALTDAWKQSALSISFDRQGTTLGVTVSSFGTDYFSLGDRSDGLKIFIALRVFLARRQHEVRPILLVDEAESHLHYDAQADITRVFEQQSEVAQVIYTTHSIGCLPQDLGRGVRVVTPEENSTRSHIENVWSRVGGDGDKERRVGITPLMLAMGASTVPLTPTRFVVVAEGPSDAMLLPSLLREASGLDVLGYQVVGGLSEASEDEIRRLGFEAPRVCYLVDGDHGGSDLQVLLRRLGVPARRIVRWAGPSTGVCLEDAVDPDLYVQAINRYLTSWPPNKSGLTKAALRKAARPKQVDEWCDSQKIKRPSKVMIAQQILEILDEPVPSPGVRLTDSGRTSLLVELNRRLRKALDLPLA